MTDTIDHRHFRDLAAQNPTDVCRRAGCTYDAANGVYAVAVWDDIYRIRPRQRTITSTGRHDQPVHDYLRLFAIHYLLHAHAIDPVGTWISAKDMAGGPTFFRGPHTLPTDLIASRFKNDIAAFKAICRGVQGVPLDMADAACRLTLAPRIPVALLYWLGDDDFPARVSMLFDATVTRHLALDIVYAMAVAICRRLGSAAG